MLYIKVKGQGAEPIEHPRRGAGAKPLPGSKNSETSKIVDILFRKIERVVGHTRP